MLCAYCGRRCVWPDDFPSRVYAKCAACVAAEPRAMKQPSLPGLFVGLSVLLVLLVACYRCVDPACSNLPPVEPDYPGTAAPPPLPRDAGPG